MNLSELDGAEGFRVTGSEVGEDEESVASAPVAGVGDFNGDGFDDVIVGSPEPGKNYLVFGTSTGFPPSVDVSTLDGTNGFLLFGDSLSGSSVSAAGDVNGDGLDDLMIGAPADHAACVVFGSSARSHADIDLRELDGTDGFRIVGATLGTRTGGTVASAGDVNGDGFDDVIVGAPGFVRFAPDDFRSYALGHSYVVFGSGSGFNATLDIADLDGSNGFRLGGLPPGARLGASVAGAGDFNGDGIDDLIVGAPEWFPEQPFEADGASFVVFGTTEGFDRVVDLSALDTRDGFRIDGPDGSHSGSSVSGAGDVNHDGYDDLMVGGGSGHIVFGFDPTARQEIFGTSGRDRLVGTAADEAFHPGGGRDKVVTGRGEDVIYFDDRAGRQDRLKISDFDPEHDRLDLQGAEVVRVVRCPERTRLMLEGGDHDRIVLAGAPEVFDDLVW